MLIDGFGREVNYLRISVTERCNFRCQYCMPEKPFSWVPKENIMSYEDMFKFVKVAIDNGVNKIRITGGEPLLREGLDNFVAMIYNYKNDIDLALTTNGFLLPSVAKRLKEAGFSEKEINSIHGPIGIKLGGRSAPEIALSIIAQLVTETYNK